MDAKLPGPKVQAILDRLLEVRRIRAWSQADMAAHLNLTEEAYRALEKGRTIRLEWDTVLRLMDIVENSQLTLNWFFGRNEAIAGLPGLPTPLMGFAAGQPLGVPVESVRSSPAGDVGEPAEAESGSPNNGGNLPPLPSPVSRQPKRRRKRGFRSPTSGTPIFEPDQLATLPVVDGRFLLPSQANRIPLTPSPEPGAFGLRLRGTAWPAGFQEGDALVCEPGSPDSGRPGLFVLRDRSVLLATLTQVPNAKPRLVPLDRPETALSCSEADILASYKVTMKVSRSFLPREPLPPVALPAQ